MTQKKKAFLTFIISFLLIAIILFCFPINLFDGEIVQKMGLVTYKIQRPLSLSYFIGLGFDEKDMVGIQSFYLLPKGYILAILVVIGFPALTAYRVYLGKKKLD